VPEFFETRMGQKFYEGTMPELLKAIKELTKELKRANDMRVVPAGKRGENPEIDAIVDAFWKQFNR